MNLQSRATIRICFVCAGNICRSPTAEAIMKALVANAGLAQHVHVESAGTSAFGGGAPPDHRSVTAAAQRGIAVAGSSRIFQTFDFECFDYVVAMDARNRSDLLDLASDREDRSKVSLMRDFDPESHSDLSVPDPYLGDRGFEQVFDICQAACQGLLKHIVARHSLG